jgi:uncharacterized protein (DUF983 family)
MENKKYYCPRCKKEVSLKMYPDYSSSGLWCAECGLNFADIKEIPPYLKHAINGWIIFYDYLSSDKSHHFINYQSFPISALEWSATYFNAMGNVLCDLVNSYIECEYVSTP